MQCSRCLKDVLPARLLREVFETVSPVINSSLAAGVRPASLKDAAVEPLLTKPYPYHNLTQL